MILTITVTFTVTLKQDEFTMVIHYITEINHSEKLAYLE